MSKTQGTIEIGIVVFDGVEELDFVGPYEVLKQAEERQAPVRVRLVAVDGLEITGARGLRFFADGRLSDDLDLVIVPGGGWEARGDGGTWGEVKRGVLGSKLVAAQARGATIASVCTGGMVLANAGLLAGRPASTHHCAIDELGDYDAHYVDARVVDDGDVLTSGGVVAGLDLALWLVERHFGRELAAAIEEEIEYSRRGPLWVNGRWLESSARDGEAAAAS